MTDSQSFPDLKSSVLPERKGYTDNDDIMKLFDTIENHEIGSHFPAICPKCGWGVASSYFDPIGIEPTEYTVILLDGNKDSVEVIRAVNKVSHCNLLKSKQLIENAPCVIFSGDALEVHEMKEILDEEAVLYRIEPDYPYD